MIKAYVKNNITTPLTYFKLQRKESYKHLKTLDLVETGVGKGDIDLLIGCDYDWTFLSGKIIKRLNRTSCNGKLRLDGHLC